MEENYEKFTPLPQSNEHAQNAANENESVVMGLVREIFARLPHRALILGRKEEIWMRIQSEIRKARLEESPKKPHDFRLLSIFRLNKASVTALVVLIAVSLASGVAKAYKSSLPGEALYPVKKAVERVEIALATSDEQKVKVLSNHAKRRLVEITTLVQEKKTSQVVAETVKDLKSTTEQVVSVASESKPELVDHAVNLVKEEQKILTSVEGKAEGDVKQVIREAISQSEESISKLKVGDDEKAEVEGSALENQETSSTTLQAVPQASKPKIQDGLIESQIQIHGVTKSEEENNQEPQEPEIIPEPTMSF